MEMFALKYGECLGVWELGCQARLWEFGVFTCVRPLSVWGSIRMLEES
jgi:hypothetical protein